MDDVLTIPSFSISDLGRERLRNDKCSQYTEPPIGEVSETHL